MVVVVAEVGTILDYPLILILAKQLPSPTTKLGRAS